MRRFRAVRFAAAAVTVAAALCAAAVPAAAGGRTVVGTVEKVDPAAGILSVRDGKGVRWNYVAAKDSGIDLGGLTTGDRVAVTIARSTPLNMISAADTLRKGDRVERVRGRRGQDSP